MNDYQAKFVAPEQAVKAVQSGDWVDYGFGAGFPELLDKALAARKGEVKDVKVRGGLVIRPRIEVVEADPEQESFSYYSWHVGDYERKLQKNGLVKFMPVMLRSLPYLYRDKHIRCDVAFVPVSKPDENGYCGLGISNYAWRTIFESARTVIFEINEHYPKLQGVDGSHRVHLSEADYIVEGEHEPLPVRSYRAPSETDIAIAKIVVNEIPDGAVLSLGVGGVATLDGEGHAVDLDAKIAASRRRLAKVDFECLTVHLARGLHGRTVHEVLAREHRQACVIGTKRRAVGKRQRKPTQFLIGIGLDLPGNARLGTADHGAARTGIGTRGDLCGLERLGGRRHGCPRARQSERHSQGAG